MKMTTLSIPLCHFICLFVSALFLTLSACGNDKQKANEVSTDFEDVYDVDDKSISDPMSLSFRPQKQSITEIVEVPETGINLGWGWNRNDAKSVRSICVEFVEAAEMAQTRFMSMSEVSDSYELMKSMGMSAKASVKTIGYKASGKAKFAKDSKVSTYSSNFVMNANVENGVRYASPTTEGFVRLTKEAEQLAMRDIEEFEHQCGDSFVSAVYSGAKLTAVISIATSSQSEKQKLSAKLTGAGWGANFEANIKEESASTTASNSMSLSIFQTGGSGDGIPKSSEDLLNKLEYLPKLAFEAPKDFNMAITPYESLANWPAKPLVHRNSEFVELASYWGAYNSLYDEYEEVLNNSSNYTVPLVIKSSFIALSNEPAQAEDKENDKPTPLTKAQIQRMANIQDDILDSLLRLQNFARYCTTADEECEFPVESFRNPVAFRAQLPMEILQVGETVFTDKEANPISSTNSEPKYKTTTITKTTTPDNTTTITEVFLCNETEACSLIEKTTELEKVEYSLSNLAYERITRPAKRRCQLDINDPLCMSNSQISEWTQKVGFNFIKFDTIEARDAAYTKISQSRLIMGKQRNDSAKEMNFASLLSVEPNFPALWYHPDLEPCIKSESLSCSFDGQK